MYKYVARIFVVAFTLSQSFAFADQAKVPSLKCWGGIRPPANGFEFDIKLASNDIFTGHMVANCAGDGCSNYYYDTFKGSLLSESPLKLSYEGDDTPYGSNAVVHAKLDIEKLLTPGANCMGPTPLPNGGAYNECEFRGTLERSSGSFRDSQWVECKYN